MAASKLRLEIRAGRRIVAVAARLEYWARKFTSVNDNHLNYVFTPDHHVGNVNTNAGQVVLRNFTAILATNQITGWLKDNYGNPIVEVEIYASTTISGLDYDQEMDTDSNGNYWL
jgi:hypothetical protein